MFSNILDGGSFKTLDFERQVKLAGQALFTLHPWLYKPVYRVAGLSYPDLKVVLRSFYLKKRSGRTGSGAGLVKTEDFWGKLHDSNYVPGVRNRQICLKNPRVTKIPR
jgi:hypothetical protein